MSSVKSKKESVVVTWLVAGVAGVLLCSWMVWRVFRMVIQVSGEQRRRHQRVMTKDTPSLSTPKPAGQLSYSFDAIRSSLNESRDAVKNANPTLLFSSVSAVLFWVGLLLRVMLFSLVLNRLDKSDRDDHFVKQSLRELQNSNRDTRIIFGLAISMQQFAYVSLLIAMFERLRLTFLNSVYRLDVRMVRVLRYSMGILTLVTSVSIPLLFISEFWAALFIAPAFIGYPSFSCWILWQFKQNTWDLSRKMRDDRSDESRVRVLLESSMRLTITATISVTSTVFLMAVVISALIFPEIQLFHILQPLLAVGDALLSVFCLVCTFRLSVPLYLFVFGALHRFLYARLK